MEDLRRGRLVARRLALRAERDLELRDPRAVDPDDAQLEPVGRHDVADLGRTPELAEHEPRHRVEVLLLELGAELLVEVVDRVGAVDADVLSSIRSTDVSGRSNSSSMSPTISSSTSSSVTMPSMSPYSSMTIARCCFSRRKSARSAARSFVSGTT